MSRLSFVLWSMILVLFLVFVQNSTLSVREVVTEFNVVPSAPVRGDVVQISVNAVGGEKIPVSLSFTSELSVVDGMYKLDLSGLEVPIQLTDFTVIVNGALDLNVAVEIGFWISRSTIAKDGKAVISQAGIPAGNYNTRVFGSAMMGKDRVILTAVARMIIKTDSTGTFTLRYPTGMIPAGMIITNVGGVVKTISISEPSNRG